MNPSSMKEHWPVLLIGAVLLLITIIGFAALPRLVGYPVGERGQRMSQSSMKGHRPILFIGAVVLLITVIGFAAVPYFAVHPVKEGWAATNWVLSLSLAAAALFNFFGFLWYLQSLGGPWALDKGGMRLAIVASVITVYLVLVCTTSYFTNVREMPPETEALLTHFRTVVLVVVGFYFGTSAWVETCQKGGKPADEDTKKQPP